MEERCRDQSVYVHFTGEEMKALRSDRLSKDRSSGFLPPGSGWSGPWECSVRTDVMAMRQTWVSHGHHQDAQPCLIE